MYLAILKTTRDRKIADPVVTGYTVDGPKVFFQNLVMIPKVWAPYFYGSVIALESATYL